VAPSEGAVDLAEARLAQPAELEVERSEDVSAGRSERGIEIARVDAGRPDRVDPSSPASSIDSLLVVDEFPCSPPPPLYSRSRTRYSLGPHRDPPVVRLEATLDPHENGRRRVETRR
jgi:hypothetical protein